MNEKRLIEAALKAQKNAVSPYSGFAVGAALCTEDQVIYGGCNIENGAFSPSICAERVAFFSAIAAGERKFTAIAIVGNGKSNCYPCGVCRQVMAEFCDEDFIIIAAKNKEEFEKTTLGALLPKAFHLK